MIRKGDLPGHPFRGNQWITAGSSVARAGKLKATSSSSAVGHEKATALAENEYSLLSSQVDKRAASLTSDESSAFSHYYGDNYGGISGFLRGKSAPDFEPARKGNRYYDIMGEYVASLDTGYKKLAVEVPRKTTVYRGVRVPKGQEFQVGDEIRDDSYASTSTNPNVALRFAGSGVGAGSKPKGSVSVVLAIVLPKGHKAVVGGQHTPYRGEKEVLVDKGTKMKVVSVEKWRDPGSKINVEKVTVEIVP